MARSRSGASKTTTKSKGRSASRKQKAEEPLFHKGAVVAIAGSDSDINFKLVKLLQDVYENSDQIRVNYLKRYEEEPLLYLFVEENVQHEISDRDIISDAETGTVEKKLKKKGPATTLIELKRHSFNKIKKLAKNFVGATTKSNEEESEDEEEEEEEEEDEEEEKRPIKKVVGKKSAKKKEEEEEEAMEEEEEEEEEVTGKGRRGRSAKKEEVTRASKKQKLTGKKGKATKKEEYDEGEEEEEEEDDGKKKKKAKKEAKKPNKYKKGKWNPNVEIIEKCDMLQSDKSEFIDYESMRANNKNVIRAAYTGNVKLFEKIASTDYAVSTFFERWGPECDMNAIELIFKNNDKKLLQAFLKVVGDKNTYKLGYCPPSQLTRTGTGSNSKFFLGTAVRAVEMGRGGKEGNNAFVHDETNHYPWDEKTMQRILQCECDVEMYNMLRAACSNLDYSLDQGLEHAVTSGNIKTAAYIAQRLSKNGGWGLNDLHVEILTKNDPKQIKEFKKVSITKKSMNSNITPVHYACINPNGKILEHLLAHSPEYTVADWQMRKPIHYAAACTTPEPLKVLLSKQVDYREGDRMKNTPLMIACKYGRDKNVEVILDQEDKTTLNAKNKEGMMAVHLAAENGHLKCLQALHKHGVDLNANGKNRMTPLMLAAAHGHFDCVKWLLENGAKILKRDKFKRNAVIMAARNGQLKILSYLLQNGGEFNKPDSSDNWAIHYAAAYGFEECIDVLMQASKDVDIEGGHQNVTNSWKLTPLTVAMLKNNIGCMKKLLSYPGTNVNCKDEQGRTLIMCAIEGLDHKNFEQIKYLIKEKGAALDLEDNSGRAALHYACELDPESLASGSIPNWHEIDEKEQEKRIEEYTKLRNDLITLLLDNGADVNQKNKEGQVPFVIALESGHFDVCDTLLARQGVDLCLKNAKDQGIYHLLSSVIMQEKGIDLFHRIADLIGPKDDLHDCIDYDGLTPVLRLLQAYSSGAFTLLGEYYNELSAAALEKKQKEFDAQHGRTTKLAGGNDFGVTLRGGARTKQTARKSTGGMAPRKQLASKAARFVGFGGFGGFGSNSMDNMQVTLTAE